jgi:ubiquinone/menaquinone biosynthesis C-methylase UbiE
MLDDGFSFDTQATRFDRRAGLPASALAQIAEAVLALAGSGLLLEIGAGTGEIGLGLAAAANGYLGIDLSLPMLQQAQARFSAAGVIPHLIQGDANADWPLPAGSVGLVFISRAAHWLHREHIADEIIRTCHADGGCLVLGRVCRQESSIRTALRREMRRLLVLGGALGRSGEQSHRRLVQRLVELGGVASLTQPVAHWLVAEIPAQAIEAWRGKPGLAGVSISVDEKNALLDQLEAWAWEQFGDLHISRVTEARYELTAVRLPPPLL